jgi:DDE superfamily endonuclease
MNPKCSANELSEGSKRICDVYKEAPKKWKEEGIKTLSTDEKTGMQILERNATDLQMMKGQVCRQEYEYTRHGTLCLIANWDVSEGKIISPTISETRTEEDFLAHIQQTVQNNPEVKGWRFVVDNLNTHQSGSLVKWVASLEGIEEAHLGIKGKKGILKSKESRSVFLKEEGHFVQFIYTPKHCSWLNQIEIWFGILARKVLKRGSFKTKEELTDQLNQFIIYFNTVLSKPFKWTYGGKPCYL